MSQRDRLLARELSAPPGEKVIGQRIIIIESTRSTNDFLLQMLTPELPEGCVVFAEEQTAGRGQRGNRWESASRLGLWCSVLLRPRLALAESARLTDWAARAVAATVARQAGLEPVIKPPNDIYVAGRKIAGVLVDTRNRRGRIGAAVIGIGINLNQALEDFPIELRERAGSLAMISGAEINRTVFAAALLQELERTRINLDRHPGSNDAPVVRPSRRSPRASADKSVAKSPMV